MSLGKRWPVSLQQKPTNIEFLKLEVELLFRGHQGKYPKVMVYLQRVYFEKETEREINLPSAAFFLQIPAIMRPGPSGSWESRIQSRSPTRVLRTQLLKPSLTWLWNISSKWELEAELGLKPDVGCGVPSSVLAINQAPTSLVMFKGSFIYSLKRQSDRDGERDREFPITGSFLKRPQHPDPSW